MNDRNQENSITTKQRERENIVKWMREVMSKKPTSSERKAFMAKMNSICIYHNITMEELIADDK